MVTEGDYSTDESFLSAFMIEGLKENENVSIMQTVVQKVNGGFTILYKYNEVTIYSYEINIITKKVYNANSK